MTRTILIVEDEAIPAKDYQIIVENAGFKVVGIATTSTEAIAIANKEKPNIILMDINLKGEDSGIDAARAIYNSYGPEIVFITGLEEEVLVFTEIRYIYIKKPIYEWSLLNALS
jgi:CheY-like chemotaxis protein